MSTDKREPVKYTVLEKSLIGNEMFEAGQTCEYSGLPAENLAPQCEVGHARYQEYLTSNAQRVAVMAASNPDGSGADSAAFAKAVAAAIVEAQASQAELISAAVAAALAKVFPNGTGKAAVREAEPVV